MTDTGPVDLPKFLVDAEPVSVAVIEAENLPVPVEVSRVAVVRAAIRKRGRDGRDGADGAKVEHVGIPSDLEEAIREFLSIAPVLSTRADAHAGSLGELKRGLSELLDRVSDLESRRGDNELGDRVGALEQSVNNGDLLHQALTGLAETAALMRSAQTRDTERLNGVEETLGELLPLTTELKKVFSHLKGVA